MSQPPKDRELDATVNRLDGHGAEPSAAGQVENRLPFGASAEGLCQTMPELGNIPFVQGREKDRREVRLVSMNAESDVSITLQNGVNKIGRQHVGNHIVLVSGEISRFHAELQVSGDDIVVRDLGSSNGTFVNRQKIQEAHLEAGDLIGFSCQFLFRLQIDLAMQTPEVVTLEQGGKEPLPQAPTPVPAPPGEVPVSLEERRRKLDQAQPIAPHGPEAPAPAGGPLGRQPTAPRGIGSLSRPGVPAPPPPSAPIPPLPRPAPIVPGPSRSSAAPVPVQSTSPGTVQPVPPALPRPAAVPTYRTPSPPRSPLGPMPGLPPVLSPEQRGAPAAPISATPSAAARPISPADSLLEPIEPIADADAAAGDLAILERERRQLAVLYQVSKRCMAAENLAELDRLLINVLERIAAFERGFITYQLPNGDWKLVMSPKGDRWDRTVVRGLLHTALRGRAPVVIKNTALDDKLGSPGPNRTDARLLLPLRTKSAPVGAIFLISARADSFDDQTVDFLSLFSDIAALAVLSCARIENSREQA